MFAVEDRVDSVAVSYRFSLGDFGAVVVRLLHVRRIVELIILCLRRRERNEVEILVLRHELDILRRQQL